MTTTNLSLPITSTESPESPDELAAVVHTAACDQTAIYPLGGQTALGYGSPVSTEGIGLSTEKLNRTIDYPARDMTITVEAGQTFQTLAETLAEENQELPIDIPFPDLATVGGVIASGWNGHRRYGLGTLRDYVVGITAVDGRGTLFHSGGRVVKNVAGYDFCKLLTGSLGTLAVITEATFRVQPIPEKTLLLACHVTTWENAERVLAQLPQLSSTPVAIDCVAGSLVSKWSWLNSPNSTVASVLVRLQGTTIEVDWMTQEIQQAWSSLSLDSFEAVSEKNLELALKSVAGFPSYPVGAESTPKVSLKITIPPSQVTHFCGLLLAADPGCEIFANAGSGILYVRFEDTDSQQVSQLILSSLRPKAILLDGNVIVLESNIDGITNQVRWGERTNSSDWMERIKKMMDPQGILNPGRFHF